MSGGRKDWSALSSLARQWTLEDEEEQERERRRRHRNLSSTTDDESPGLTQNGGQRAAERLPSVEEAEAPAPPPPASKDEDEDIQTILRKRQERRQRRQAVEAAQASGQEMLGAEEEGDSSRPNRALRQPLGSKKELEPPPRQRLSREQRGPWAQEEQRVEGREPGTGKTGLPEEVLAPEKASASEKSPVPEKPVPAKRLASEKAPLSQKTVASEKRGSPERSVPENTRVSDRPPAPGKTPVSQKTAELEKRPSMEKKSALERSGVSEKSPERGLVSEKASVFEKSRVSETKLALRRAGVSGQPQATTEEPGGSTIPGRSRPSSAEPGPQDPPVASRLPPIMLQVKIPSREEEADTSSPTQLTYSSSLKRSSPRTISFRMSPRKDNSEAALTRSASVRLPASTIKLGEKLERYHTAVQRSKSVKSPGSSRTEVFVAPTGVASKRHLFEKELAGPRRAEPASSQKESLRLSGVVTSRLNLWISKTQESGDQDPQEEGGHSEHEVGPAGSKLLLSPGLHLDAPKQEVRKALAATKQTQWGGKSGSSLDAEV